MTGERKADHLRICLERAVEGFRTNGFERLRLRYRAFPEMALDDVDPGTDLLGRRLALPFLIAPMSGGHREGSRLLRVLAAAAERHRVALALGSLRPALDTPARVAGFRVRDLAGSVPILGNIGVWQLRDPRLRRRLLSLVEPLGLDAIQVHANPAQELVQPEGERDFSDALDALACFAEESPVPVIVKETGCGLGPSDLRALAELPILGVDVGGQGGTSFPAVEAYRTRDPARRDLGESLAAVGVSTAEALREAVAALPGALVIASGGLRTPEDALKALAMGAGLVSAGLPLLRAAAQGEGALDRWIESLSLGLRARMLLASCRTLADLRTSGVLVEAG